MSVSSSRVTFVALAIFTQCVSAEPTSTNDYLGVERITKYCGSSSVNLCFPLAGSSTSLLTVEAGGKAYDGIPDGFHAPDKAYYALDFDAKQNTTLNVVAARGGIITRVKSSGNSSTDSYWPVVRIDHGDGYYTEYAEYSTLKAGLKVGDRVETGDVLGTLASPNVRSIGADHLHFQVKFDANYDPLNPGDGSGASSTSSVSALGAVRVGGRLIEDYNLTRTDGIATELRFQNPIISGEASGVFKNPSPNCGGQPAVCSGVGTDTITWGSGGFSRLAFTSTDFDAEVGSRFEIGRLRFTNGGTFAGSEINSVELLLNTGLTDHEYASNIDLLMRLAIVNTPNTGTDAQSADYITFLDYAQYGTFRVLEGRSTSIALYARFGSLEFDGFGEVADPDAGFIAPIPEPSTYALVLCGLAAIGLAARRRKFVCQ